MDCLFFQTVDLTVSVIPPFISKKSNKRGHDYNPTGTYFSVTRAINRVTYMLLLLLLVNWNLTFQLKQVQLEG